MLNIPACLLVLHVHEAETEGFVLSLASVNKN